MNITINRIETAMRLLSILNVTILEDNEDLFAGDELDETTEDLRNIYEQLKAQVNA